MIWDIQKYSQEKRLLSKLAKKQYLSPSRKEAVKQNMLSLLEVSPQEVVISLPKESGFKRYVQVFAPVMAILLFFSGTAFASQNSLPGDTLYPVKRAVEQIEFKLAPTQALKARLAESHAVKRLEEIQNIESKQTEPENLNTTEIVEPVMSTAAVVEEEKPKTSKNRKSREEIAKHDFEAAINALSNIKERMHDKGNDNAAEKIETTILRLKERAENTRGLRSETLKSIMEKDELIPEVLKETTRPTPRPENEPEVNEESESEDSDESHEPEDTEPKPYELPDLLEELPSNPIQNLRTSY